MSSRLSFRTVTLSSLAALLTCFAFAQTNQGTFENLTQLQDAQSRRESSAKKDLSKNMDNFPIEAGATLVLGDLEGPGVITHIWTTINAKDPFYERSLVLRVYYDGAEKPSVEAPLGDFFGVGNGIAADFASTPVANSAFGRARSCFWHMPFRQRAKVTLTNESPTYRVDSFYYNLDWQKRPSLPESTAYFHAHYRQEHPAKPGDYIVLDAKGRGHYVGTVYSVLQTQIGWFGEGDDRFYIDGEEYPSLSGTGTEDYFGDAWGFREFAYPNSGVPVFEGYMPGDRVTAYRWHLSDPIYFSKSLRFTMEHYGSLFSNDLKYLGQFYERPDWVSSVAFWYQWPAATFDEPIAPVAERIAPYRVLQPKDLTAKASTPFGLQKSEDAVGLMPLVPDAWLEVTFNIEQAGRYQIDAILMHSFVGGIYQVSLDGKPVGAPIDFFFDGEDSLRHRLDLHDLQPGDHVLKFEGKGSSPSIRTLAPRLCAMGLERLILLRLEDVAGYMEATTKAIEAQGK
ncbi:MAG: DUF2961 domain-containing protein [Candidatus Hydrogenedentes bacterium]|nr:DUF2961 domain-containing protein [Candidatus Hydrogenedentota bacterium]